MLKCLKRLLCLCLASIGFLMITSCENESINIKQSSVNEDTVNGLVKLSDTNISFDDVEIIPGQDDLSYLDYPFMAVTDEGYYYFENDFLFFFDKSVGASVKVCTQTNCDHANDDCDAYFDIRTFKTMYGIWLVEDKLYVIGSSDDLSEYAVWTLNLDGTNRERLINLFKKEGDEDYIYSICVHHGYLYYTLNNNDFQEAPSLYQVELKKNAKPLVIYTADSENCQLYRLKGYGNGIFFQQGYYPNKNLDDVENYYAVLNYITDDGSCYLAVEGPEKYYNIIDNNVYYTTNNSIRIYDMKTGEDTEFLKTDRICSISYDENYIYLDDFIGVLMDDNISSDTRKIYVYDYDGNEVCNWNIPTSQSSYCLFGDANYLWMYCYENGGEWSETETLKALDKSQIASGNAEWFRWK